MRHRTLAGFSAAQFKAAAEMKKAPRGGPFSFNGVKEDLSVERLAPSHTAHRQKSESEESERSGFRCGSRCGSYSEISTRKAGSDRCPWSARNDEVFGHHAADGCRTCSGSRVLRLELSSLCHRQSQK